MNTRLRKQVIGWRELKWSIRGPLLAPYVAVVIIEAAKGNLI